MIAVARPYAQALYEYAKENNIRSRCSDFIEMLVECINNNKITRLINTPNYTQNDVARLLIEILSDVLESYMKNFIKILAKYKRLHIIPLIYRFFLQYKEQDEYLKNVKITSASNISPLIVSAIKKKLEKKYQCNIALKIMVDPSIIGGALIKIDGQVIDYSLKRKLHKLKNELQNSFKDLDLP